MPRPQGARKRFVQRRLVSKHFKRDGTPKVKYATKQEAMEVAFLKNQVAYECDFCDGYHCGGKK
jgi:hypothetical protein